MTAYYNEIDQFAAEWLRELIKSGMIAPGEVDERSIEDVIPSELIGFTQCHFFAGIGGWSLALRQSGWPDDRPVWTGSCPCQPFSAAGKGAGFADERHLWPAFFHLIKECGPVIVFGEQVASKDTNPWFDLVQADLEQVGYAFGCVPFAAAGVGSPQIRERAYWVADSIIGGFKGERWGGRTEKCRATECGEIGGLADTQSGRICSGLCDNGSTGERRVFVTDCCGNGGMDNSIGNGRRSGRNGDNGGDVRDIVDASSHR